MLNTGMELRMIDTFDFVKCVDSWAMWAPRAMNIYLVDVRVVPAQHESPVTQGLYIF